MVLGIHGEWDNEGPWYIYGLDASVSISASNPQQCAVMWLDVSQLILNTKSPKQLHATSTLFVKLNKFFLKKSYSLGIYIETMKQHEKKSKGMNIDQDGALGGGGEGDDRLWLDIDYWFHY